MAERKTVAGWMAERGVGLAGLVEAAGLDARVVEALVKAGAFDRLHPDRACTLASVPLAFEWAEAQAANAQQHGLFDFGSDDGLAHGASTQEPQLASAEPWSCPLYTTPSPRD